MKIEYKLEPKEEVSIEENEQLTTQIHLDTADVIIDTKQSFLECIHIVFTNLPIRWEATDTSLINQEYHDIRRKAYKISTYLANYILLQTGQDVFNLEDILQGNFQLTPETEEEKATFSTHKKRVSAEITFSYSILGVINLADYGTKYYYADAFSNYADGERTSNPVTKFEKYYRVIETFYDKKGDTLDQVVSLHIEQFEPLYTSQFIKSLRLLRNQCTHPKHNKGHITSDNIELFSELSKNISAIKKLAKLLLANPPL